MNKIIKITIIVFLFVISKSYSIENVKELTDAISDAREKFNNISEPKTEQSIIIDEAIKEIDKATEYVQEAINNDNAEDAIKTLEFIEKTLTDVESIIPQEFSSDMNNIDPTAIPKDDMDIINELTKEMNAAKEKKANEFMADLIELNQRGIDTISISENLNSLGIDTIKISLNLDESTKIENWTKEEWAESYKGSILTSAGSEVITDKEINNKVVSLEEKLQANNIAILEKRTSLTELQTKIDPLTNQITELETQKTSLLAEYNEEILKQSSTVLSDQEINQSKDLANQLNNQLSEITSDIEVAESQSNAFQQQIQSLNSELTNQISVKTQLENNIRDLNNKLSVNRNILSAKTSELNQLKNNDLNLKAKDLNDSLEKVTLQRDFVQRDFDKALDKEVEAFQRYYSALGEVEADNYDIQAEYAVREVRNILNPDPKQYRAFEYEKYSKLAGLPQSVIDEGLNAIANDDWNTQKKITKKIMKALEKNPQAVLPNDWSFSKITDGEINTIIAEDKAIQEAVYASIELNNMREKVNLSIAEKTKDIQPLASLNAVNLERFGGNYSLAADSFREGSIEYDFFQKERETILSGEMGEKLRAVTEDLSTTQNKMNQIIDLNQQRRETIEKVTARVQKEINSNNSKISELQSELTTNSNNFYESYNSAVLEVREKIYGPGGSTIGGPTEEFEKLDLTAKSELFDKWDGLKRGEQAIRFANMPGISKDITGLTPDLKKLGKKMNETQSKIQDLKILNSEKGKEITKAINENKTDWNTYYEVSGELRTASLNKISIDNEIKQQAAQNLLENVRQAQTEYNQIVDQESKDLTQYRNKISNILKEIPTFENRADSLIDLDPVRLRAKLVDLASDGNFNESAAVEAALKELGEIGDAPVSEFMTGPYWEASNIKTAAIVRAKKYSYVDDYAHYSAYSEDPLALNAANRRELEGELKDVLGDSNPVLDALNEKVKNLSTELNLTQEQSQNITTEMAKLENELSSLKSSEGDLQKQINDLTNQLNSKERLITEKTQNLSSIQEQLNPISERMNSLQGQRAELDGKLNDQLNNISNQIKNQGQVTDEANALKSQFEKQIAELDNKLRDYQNQNTVINSQLTSLTAELSVLEVETPEIAIQIESLNKDLKNFKNIKADLAMATAKKIGLDVDEKALQSVEILDGRVVIAVKGTELVRVVDKKMLIDQASKFVDPLSELSINTKIYTVDAVKPELLTQALVTDTYGQAKKLREKAVKRVNELENTPGVSEAELNAAKASREIAKYTEIAAGQSLVKQSNVSSVVVQKANLKTLKEIQSTPGMNKFDVRRTEAAVRALEAKIAGTSYDYEGAISKITVEENKFNSWRVDSYKKEIDLAKANGNEADLRAYTRRLNNFQQRLVDEKQAYEAATARTNYFEALSEVATRNLSGASTSSLQQTAKTAATNITEQSGDLEQAAEKKSTGITSAFETAKAAREQIDKNMNELRSSGASKATLDAAQAARDAALQAEIAAANAVTSASNQATLETLRQVANTPGMDKWSVRAANAAVRAAETAAFGPTLENTYKDLKYAKEKAVDELEKLQASGASEEAINAAKAARDAATSAQKAAVDQAVAQASAAVKGASTAAKEAAEQASKAVAKSAAQDALDTLKEIASTPGMNKWDVRRANAAVKRAEAEMAGTDYDYQGAINKINKDESDWNKSRGN